MDNQRPKETWSVERLGEFCSLSRKKLAVEAWRFGHALNLARAKQPHGDWQKWKSKYVAGLSHSSEHRYRTLAEKMSEDSLEGLGVTEAYRLLDLTHTKSKTETGDDLFPQAPGAILAGSEVVDDDGLDDSHDLGEFTLPDPFPNRPCSVGVLEVEAEPEPSQATTGVLDAEREPKWRYPTPVTGPMEIRSPEERYRLYLTHGSQHLEALLSWADWLKVQDEGFRYEMWDKHGTADVEKKIDRTIEGLRSLAENLLCVP